jgi:hypothetical protein
MTAHVAEMRSPLTIDRRALIFTCLSVISLLTIWYLLDQINQMNWTGDPNLPEPGRDGTPKPRQATPQEQGETSVPAKNPNNEWPNGGEGGAGGRRASGTTAADDGSQGDRTGQ